MTRYVVGFLIDVDYTVLIRKKRPKWQEGLLNGIGGHVEPSEGPHEAMVREFQEEAGVHIASWKRFAILRGNNDGGWEVHFFWAYGTLSKCKTQTDEELEICNIRELSNPVIYTRVMENLPWLFGMIESQKRDNVDYYDVTYRRTT